ncbi:MAG: UDP-N-acetylmuramate dehydrogenase [Fusobacteriaceae bacterium]
MKILKNHIMKEHSNMKIGGITKNFFIVETKNELKDVMENYENVFIIGNGTNTLIKDGELKTNFASLKNINYIDDKGQGEVEVGAGLDFWDFVKYCETADYSGIENLAGIPGTVGGLVYMNGGAYGSEIFDHITEIEILDENRELRKIRKEKIDFSYRNTEIQAKGWIVLSAKFKFEKGYKKELVEERESSRGKKHPLELPNLGSSFKNPEGFFAAKLIIQAGMQGYQVGDAQISTKHPNFIVNLGNATYEDMRTLINIVKDKVKEITGIALEEEIVIVDE